MASHPRLFTIPPGAPFLETLADALTCGGRLHAALGLGEDPLALASATIYLPTRRTARAFGQALAVRAGGVPILLPRIVALGEEEEGLAAVEADAGAPENCEAAYAASVRPIDRVLVLSDLILRWTRSMEGAEEARDPRDPLLVGNTAGDAVALSGGLARLLDALATEGRTFEDLRRIVPSDFDRYWERTLTFLEIAAERWPSHLSEHGLIDIATRRDTINRARAHAYAQGKTHGPVIAAGSTGQIPSTAELLDAIARLSMGAVVLPGLDLGLDEEAWGLTEAAPTHPQFVLQRTLRDMGADRAGVEVLGEAPSAIAARARALSAAMRPTPVVDDWPAIRAKPEEREAIVEGLAGVTLIEASDEREEALAIALVMREALETPGRTAALATPDRALAEGVAAALGRWGLEVDGSAGTPLDRSPSGMLARLVAEAAASAIEPRLLLTVLAQPSATFGMSREAVRRAGGVLEVGALRGHAAPKTLAALREVMTQRRGAAGDRFAPRPARRFVPEDWDALDELLDRVEDAFSPFTSLRDRHASHDLRMLAAAHRLVLGKVRAREPGEPDAPPDADDEALDALFDEIEGSGEARLPTEFEEYPAVFLGLAAGMPGCPPKRAHRRLKIWGLAQARLLTADVVILGGLNETSWPARPPVDAFLNRAMREVVGLPSPERAIGQAAHDFIQALGAREAVLTRARKQGGVPTLPSRFLQRLEAYAGIRRGEPTRVWEEMRARGERIVGLARLIDEAPPVPPLPRPAPKPDPALVPRRLSITETETLIRDPYAIYARHVLGLDPLPPIDPPIDFALRGQMIHDAVARFTHEVDPAHRGALGRLLQIGEEEFQRAGLDPERRAFWWPRYVRAARWFVAWERGRRPGIAAVATEERGQLFVDLPDNLGAFRLTGRADRIERLTDGTLAIVDFKTGGAPGPGEVMAGLSPQLTLEAVMAERGAFAAFPEGGEVSGLLYVRLFGPAAGGEEKPLAFKGEDGPVPLREVAHRHFEALRRRLAEHLSGERGFASRLHPRDRNASGPYDHLARVAEWTRGGAGLE